MAFVEPLQRAANKLLSGKTMRIEGAKEDKMDKMGGLGAYLGIFWMQKAWGFSQNHTKTAKQHARCHALRLFKKDSEPQQFHGPK